MERRKFVIGLGSLAAGGAAAAGTGAFTTVDADRDVTVDVADDAEAYLGLRPAQDDDDNVAENADEFIDDEDDALTVDLTQTDAGGEGFNPNATTVVDNLVEATNQGSQDGVGVWVDVDFGTGLGDGDFTVYAQDSVEDDDRTVEDLEDEAAELDTGESIVIGVEVETGGEADLSGSVTFNADVEEDNWP